MNFLYFVGAEIGGFVAIIYSKWITDNTGRIEFAEHYLGRGGTYSMWKIIGVLLIIGGFWLLFNA